MTPAQASRVLETYLGPAEERAISVQAVRVLDGGRGYVELSRRYVVRGTSEEAVETVLLGFRWDGARWHLREVRLAP